jgi:UDP-N-acetylmuramyl tripeptide synthase
MAVIDVFSAKVAVARAAAWASRRTGSGGGTSLPGKVLLRLDANALGRLAQPLAGTTLVSATNGKTTTAKMAATVLERAGRSLCRNAGGANLGSGVASALLSVRAGQTGLFEVDEAALEDVARALAPEVLVLGNLFRDQLDRYGELELVGERWRCVVAGLRDNAQVLYNADDPLVASIARGARGATPFGIADRSLARPTMQHASDSKWCVVCGSRLAYHAILLGHMGDWYCPACGAARPEPAVRAAAVRAASLEGSEFRLEAAGETAAVRLPVPGLYNVYNALAAAAIGLAHGVPLPQVAEALSAVSAAFGRFERIDLGSSQGVLLLIKNPAGANEVIRTLAGEPARKRLLVALNDRIADGRDVSWIWDVDFEELAGQVDQVVTTGTRAAEMAMRLKYAGVDPARLRVEPDAAVALDLAADGSDGGHVFLLATYTAMLELRGMLSDRGLVRPFWEAA